MWVWCPKSLGSCLSGRPLLPWSPWVRRRCFKGLPDADTGALDAQQVEFLANVDQPAESELWVQYYRRAQAQLQPQGGGKEGGGPQRWGYLAVIFRHNAHENHAYNPMARMARGKLVALLQDDDGGPRNATGLRM